MMNTVFNEEIFNPAFTLDGPHLVAASAGTGKTHNIQNICARLVMERGMRISEILVVTFTKAATKELRERIRKVLADLQRFLSGDMGGMKPNEIERLDNLLRCAREKLGEEADAKAKAAVELALLEFDQAAISTIHGFCQRVLRRFAFETAGAFQTDLGEDSGTEAAHRARDWWRVNRPSFPLSELIAAVKALVEKVDWKLEKNPDTGEISPCLAAAAEIASQYEKDRSVRERQTYNDLLRSVRSALDPANDPVRAAQLRKRLREEFKAVVVDEFQDTDPTQYAIFKNAFIDGDPEDKLPPLFFVGDPKQAIYSFRGGDIFTYRSAAKSPEIAGHTYHLNQNFRSTPLLVDAVNRLFMDVESGKRTFGDDTIPYADKVKASDIKGLPARSNSDSVADPDPHPFRIVAVENATDRKAAVIDTVLETLAEQRQLHSVIKNKDGVEEPFGPQHIAVLVSSNNDGRDFAKELRSRNVPAVFERPGNVFSGETAAQFRLVLMAMAGMGGRSQIRSALATPFFDFPVGDLEKDDGQTLADAIGDFGSLNTIWTKRGFNAAFVALESKGGFRTRFASLPDGERKLADVFQIVDLANKAIRERGPAPDSLVDWITERINLANDKSAEADSEEYARELESDADAVKIMTVHVAKGLEFPVTIVPVPSPFKGGYRDGGAKPPNFHHDESGTLLVGQDYAKAAADDENEDESMRKLYVAFTRATKRAIVISSKNPIPAFSRLLENARSRGAGDDNPQDSPIRWEPFKPSNPPLPNYRPDTPIAPATLCDAEVPRGYSQHRQKGSYSSLSPSLDEDVDGEGGNASRTPGGDADPSADGLDMDANPSHHEEDGIEADEHPIFSIGGGARTGTCWHDILEKLPFDATDEMIREGTLRSMRLHGLARGDEKKVDEDVATVSEMIRKTLDWPIVSPSGAKFKLSDVPMDRRFSEWEFDFSSAESVKTTEAIATILKDEWKDDPAKALFLKAAEKWNRQIPKGFLVGFLDLLFEHDGFFYVVDWKSNKVGGKAANFAEEGIKAEMAKEGYFFQYLLYSAVLHRFLKETLGSAYSWERNFGGVRYYFLRGIAAEGNAPVFEDRPGKNMLDRLCDALGLKD